MLLVLPLWLLVAVAEEASVPEAEVGQFSAEQAAVSAQEAGPPAAPASRVTDYAQSYQALQLSDMISLSKETSRLMSVLDADKDGSLSADEVSNARRALLKADTNNDGVLDSAELGIEFMHPAVLRLHKLQRLLDVNGDYQLSTQEVVDAEKYLRSVDVDGNWQLDQSELNDTFSEERLSRWLQIINSEALAEAGREVPLTKDKTVVDRFYLLQQIDLADALVVGGGTQLLNVNREVVHQWPQNANKKYGQHVTLLENGLLLRTISDKDSAVAEYSTLELLDWNGNVVWDYKHCGENESCLYGPVVTRQNGNILVMVTAQGEVESHRGNQWVNSIWN